MRAKGYVAPDFLCFMVAGILLLLSMTLVLHFAVTRSDNLYDYLLLTDHVITACALLWLALAAIDRMLNKSV